MAQAPYNYQWIVAESPNSTINGLLTGQTSTTLHVSETVPGTYKFYLLVTDAIGQAINNEPSNVNGYSASRNVFAYIDTYANGNANHSSSSIRFHCI